MCSVLCASSEIILEFPRLPHAQLNDDQMRTLDIVRSGYHSFRGVGIPEIMIFHTGLHMPEYVSPMPRDPNPNLGVSFGRRYYEVLGNSVEQNQSLHDGAVLFQRQSSYENYALLAWSCRLFPPNARNQVKVHNRGSAFNSCLALSATDQLDLITLFSAKELLVFSDGDCWSAT